MDEAKLKAAQEQSQKIQAIKQKRDAMMKQLLAPEAMERLTRIKLVKPEMAEQVTNMILSMASKGAIKSKVSGDTLKSYLAQINQEKTKKSVIKFARRPFGDEDSDSEDYDDM
mmetsp:Transcript_35562/g.57137  ORF Transcript_35562/g.57137 Transcript_35562/m.57137 type:complete len:113 (-) Transcript_35562:347-685(-)|eukprot:jgi/Bigna1/86577/estExt_fgenesh1_pg.C_110261